MIKLILFDIDGTLVLTGGAGGRAMWFAARDIFSIEESDGSIAMAGRTDAWIVAQMAKRCGVACSAAVMQAFHDRYIEHLEREIHQAGPRKGVLPGIAELLTALSRQSDAAVGLLTGNFRKGAELKLRYFDLWHHFGAGAFGDTLHDRNALLAVALEEHRAADQRVITPAEVLIVGDTPLDVAVAVAGGARSLAVATGDYDAAALRASGADVVVEDFSDLNAALDALRIGPGQHKA